MSFFGFIPSEELLLTIQTAAKKEHSSEPLYPFRDKTALLINDEIIDAILTELVHRFPPSEKRETAEKLAGYIKSTVAVLLKQLLSKAPNEVVKQSIEFSRKSLFEDHTGLLRVGESLDPSLVTNLKLYYAEIKFGNDINKAVFCELYKQFAEATVRHFMNDFNRTLDLGMIKRKAADLGSSAVIKATHIAIDRLIPHLSKQELVVLAEYHDTLFHE
ncbi:hypothetical protein B9T31_03560 [Acinetobacter sp. ANC 4558]|uniref:hypothetical protein n=1 Tax=Acinetobacter sp. ANC 4558 TaxID=1977876 RepID=UPI000A33EBB1|nr:hypothetical protein [Acinetobacter sp. ANC 4558]OTG87587.1 hypothetical protein B9T31_03560 [Acinetobacter sp. ANC 4558]